MDIQFHKPTSIFRIFDEAKAREFYVDFLEFKVDWEHRFEENTPLYCQVSKGDCLIHLSEHFGDSTPGGTIRIPVSDVKAYQQILIDKKYKNARPGVQEQSWKTLEMSIKDPFGNKLIFFENLPLE